MGTKYILTTPTVITREMKHNMLKFPSLRSLIHLGSIRVGPLSFGPGTSMSVGEPFYKKWRAVIDTASKSGVLHVHTVVDGKVVQTETEGKKSPVGQPAKELPPELNPTVDEVQPEATVVVPVRAHEEDGTFKADDPSTPDVDEAWEVEPVEEVEEVVEEVEEEVEELEEEEPRLTASDLNKKRKDDLITWLIDMGVDKEDTKGKTKRKLVDLAIDMELI